jgi:hypothetical protein
MTRDIKKKEQVTRNLLFSNIVLVYPFLFCLYPIIDFLADNPTPDNFFDSERSLIIVILITLVLDIILIVILHNPYHTALITAFSSFAFMYIGTYSRFLRLKNLLLMQIHAHYLLSSVSSLVYRLPYFFHYGRNSR